MKEVIPVPIAIPDPDADPGPDVPNIIDWLIWPGYLKVFSSYEHNFSSCAFLLKIRMIFGVENPYKCIKKKGNQTKIAQCTKNVLSDNANIKTNNEYLMQEKVIVSAIVARQVKLD